MAGYQTKLIKERDYMPATTALYIYWIVLVAWQNIAHLTARSGMDVFFKIALLLYLSIYFYMRSRTLSGRSAILFSVAAISMILTMIGDNHMELRSIISGAFPLVLIFFSLCLCNHLEVTPEQYIKFLKMFVFAVLYMAIYSLIFEADHYKNLTLLTTAYSNELCSFFASNMEYGMYLCFAVISIIIILYIEKQMVTWKKVMYSLMMALFSIDLILTYSRTGIITCIVMVVAFAFFCRIQKAKVIVITLTAIILLVILLVPTAREYVTKIVFKDGTHSGRDELADFGLSMYRGAKIHHKLFGYGYGAVTQYTISYMGHGSLHNGYLQVLTTNGIVGLTLICSAALVNVYFNLKLLKVDKFWGAIFFAFSLFPLLYMVTTTSILFYSSIDSSMLTFFSFLIPKYCRNYLMNQAEQKADEGGVNKKWHG